MPGLAGGYQVEHFSIVADDLETSTLVSHTVTAAEESSDDSKVGPVLSEQPSSGQVRSPRLQTTCVSPAITAVGRRKCSSVGDATSIGATAASIGAVSSSG